MTAVFIETQLLAHMTPFQSQHILGGLAHLYATIYVHQNVFQVITDQTISQRVAQLITSGAWQVFEPAELAPTMSTLYDAHLQMVTQAWLGLNACWLDQGCVISSQTQTCTFATVAASLVGQVPIIYSDNPDLVAVMQQHDLRVTPGQSRASQPLQVVTTVQLSQRLLQQYFMTPQVAQRGGQPVVWL